MKISIYIRKIINNIFFHKNENYISKYFLNVKKIENLYSGLYSEMEIFKRKYVFLDEIKDSLQKGELVEIDQDFNQMYEDLLKYMFVDYYEKKSSIQEVMGKYKDFIESHQKSR